MCGKALRRGLFEADLLHFLPSIVLRTRQEEYPHRVPSHFAHSLAVELRRGDWFLNCRLRPCLPPLDSLLQDALYQGNSMDGGAWDVYGRRDGGRQGWTTDQVSQ